VNNIRGLGENIENSIILQNILRSLPMRFDPKISALEERQDLATLMGYQEGGMPSFANSG
jgi:hypothetical protein